MKLKFKYDKSGEKFKYRDIDLKLTGELVVGGSAGKRAFIYW